MQGRDWLVGDAISLADICLFAYTHVAGMPTSSSRAIRTSPQWLERMKGQPHYVPMDA